MEKLYVEKNVKNILRNFSGIYVGEYLYFDDFYYDIYMVLYLLYIIFSFIFIDIWFIRLKFFLEERNLLDENL